MFYDVLRIFYVFLKFTLGVQVAPKWCVSQVQTTFAVMGRSTTVCFVMTDHSGGARGQ